MWSFGLHSNQIYWGKICTNNIHIQKSSECNTWNGMQYKSNFQWKIQNSGQNFFLLKCTCNVSDQKGKKKKKTCNVESYIPKCMASQEELVDSLLFNKVCYLYYHTVLRDQHVTKNKVLSKPSVLTTFLILFSSLLFFEVSVQVNIFFQKFLQVSTLLQKLLQDDNF